MKLLNLFPALSDFLKMMSVSAFILECDFIDAMSIAAMRHQSCYVARNGREIF